VTATLGSRNSILVPCNAIIRVLELFVLLDEHRKYSRLQYLVCLLSKAAHGVLTFVRSMMEWLGGTISKEDLDIEC
jgi:cleavage and polyadenylation specificity factor subunit 2